MNQNKRYVAYCKIKFWKTNAMDQETVTHYMSLHAPTQDALQEYMRYYCQHYGILECVTVDQSEYEEYCNKKGIAL